MGKNKKKKNENENELTKKDRKVMRKCGNIVFGITDAITSICEYGRKYTDPCAEVHHLKVFDLHKDEEDFFKDVRKNEAFMNILEEKELELNMENVDAMLEEYLGDNPGYDLSLPIFLAPPKKSKKKKKKKKDKDVILDDDISEAAEMLKEEDEDKDIDLEEEVKVSVPVEAEEKKPEIVIDDINKKLDTLTMLLKKYVKKGTKIIAKKTKYLDYDTTTYDVKLQYPDKEWMFMIDDGSFVPGKFSVIISSEANVMVGVPIVKKYRKLLLKIFDGYYKLNMEEMITILDENYLWNHNPMNPSMDIYRIVDFSNANAMLALNKDARNKLLVNFYTIAQMIPSFNQGRYRVKKLRNQDNFILVSDEHVKIGPGSNCVIQNIEISCTDGNIQYKQIGSDAQQAA